MTKQKFIENCDGVHLHHPTMDFTLCGDTNDGDTKVDIEPLRNTNKRIITCPRCIAIILACRGVRVSPPNKQI